MDELLEKLGESMRNFLDKYEEETGNRRSNIEIIIRDNRIIIIPTNDFGKYVESQIHYIELEEF